MGAQSGGQGRRWLLVGVVFATACGDAALTPKDPEPPAVEPVGDLPGGGEFLPEQDGGGLVEEDAGVPAPPPVNTADAGTPDAGRPTGPQPPPILRDPITFPSLPGWRFYGPQDGAPTDVLDAAEDDGGNLWVAGGEEGLCVLRKGNSYFECFNQAHGLRPYGYLPDGTAPAGPKYLRVKAVAGGANGTVYVGYQGSEDCESNYYQPKGIKDPNSYKSGDADKVTLVEGGLKVVHYDISSGKGVVSDEGGGREKICTIHRIVFDRAHNALWFGANHGFARGDPDFEGDPKCEGKRDCSGVLEHVHPHVEASSEDGLHVYRLTDAYFGIAPRPDGDVWFGGANRTTRFKFMTVSSGPINSARFEAARKASETGGAAARANRIDIWPDLVAEPTPVKPSQRRDDMVSGMALMADGTLYVGSFSQGLAQLNEQGQVLRRLFDTGGDRYVSSVARDPNTDALWVGFRWGGGVAKLQGDEVSRVAGLGGLAGRPVYNIQSMGTGAARKMVVSFGRDADGRPGFIGVYEGQ